MITTLRDWTDGNGLKHVDLPDKIQLRVPVALYQALLKTSVSRLIEVSVLSTPRLRRFVWREDRPKLYFSISVWEETLPFHIVWVCLRSLPSTFYKQLLTSSKLYILLKFLLWCSHRAIRDHNLKGLNGREVIRFFSFRLTNEEIWKTFLPHKKLLPWACTIILIMIFHALVPPFSVFKLIRLCPFSCG